MLHEQSPQINSVNYDVINMNNNNNNDNDDVSMSSSLPVEEAKVYEAEPQTIIAVNSMHG